jgi:hypothetical protein
MLAAFVFVCCLLFVEWDFGFYFVLCARGWGRWGYVWRRERGGGT